ncbi:hypothetical protein PQX77_015683 [Marasmius sp. AFHP31]|nr:hypothetical protein PQX77_015683 [Marasmius sp. AFHP31]
MGKRKKNEDDNDDDKKDRAIWTSKVEEALVLFLLETRRTNKQSDNNFKDTIYQQAAENINTKYQTQYNMTQVKSRWTRFKSDHKMVKELSEKSGFGWDDERKCVVATDEVWDALIYDEQFRKNGRKYKKWRNRAFTLFDDVGAVIEGTVATGEQEIAPGMAIGVNAIVIDPSLEDESSQPQAGSAVSDSGAVDNETPSLSDDDGPAERPVTQLSSSQPHATPAQTPISGKKRLAATDADSVKQKRQRPTINGRLNSLNDMLGVLASYLMTPERGPSSRDADSPLQESPEAKHRRHAIALVREQEGLSPHSLSRVRHIFRKPGRAVEYLGFDASDSADCAARSIWLSEELDDVEASRS